MKIGRNDPCPCGSGKKYKRCCLAKDQEAERARRAAMQFKRPTVAPSEPAAPAPGVPSPPSAKGVDLVTDALNARYETFEAADYEGKIALFHQTLDEEALMDAEMAFEMLNQLHDDSIERDERDRFEEWLVALRERLPEVYAEESHYFLKWQIDNVLAIGRMSALPVLVRELSTHAGKQIDLFNELLDQLAYHGQLSLLLKAVPIAWPLIKSSRDVVPWAFEEFSVKAAEYVIFDFLEQHPSVAADDPEFIARLEDYIEVNPEKLARHLSYLTEHAERSWTNKDFELKNQQHKQNLADLGLEFLGYLKRKEQVRYTKGDLAREQLLYYFRERQDGNLGAQKRASRALHPLCPDRATLDRFLSGSLNFINPQHHKSVATFELLPAWLRFLVSRQLITAELLEQTLQKLQPLRASLLKFYGAYNTDTALRLALECWPEQPEY
jgi:hypothetical protein